jgi:hypothetical protein
MNQPAESAGAPAAAAWPWPETLDALQAAPGHHQVLFEDDRVRVLDTRISAGCRFTPTAGRRSSTS